MDARLHERFKIPTKIKQSERDRENNFMHSYMGICLGIFIWHVYDNIWFSQSCIREIVGHSTMSADGYYDTPWHSSKHTNGKWNMFVVQPIYRFDPFTISIWNDVRSAHIKNMKMYICLLLLCFVYHFHALILLFALFVWYFVCVFFFRFSIFRFFVCSSLNNAESSQFNERFMYFTCYRMLCTMSHVAFINLHINRLRINVLFASKMWFRIDTANHIQYELSVDRIGRNRNNNKIEFELETWTTIVLCSTAAYLRVI